MDKIGEVIGKAFVVTIFITVFLLILGIAIIFLGFVGLGIESVWRTLLGI